MAVPVNIVIVHAIAVSETIKELFYSINQLRTYLYDNLWGCQLMYVIQCDIEE